MNYKSLFFIFIFSMFIGVNFSTSPLPPPYYQYNASGNVISDSLNSVANFTIQLFGMNIEFQPEYMPIQGMFFGEERPIALTDTNGYFFIVVSNPFFLDSIKAGLIQPSKPIIYSHVIGILEDDLVHITETYTKESDSGCNSCTMEPAETRIVRYEINLTNITFEL